VRKRFGVLATAAVSVTALVLVLSASVGAKTSGAPIKLMALGAINAPGFSLPSIPVGTQVAINRINAAGGINGHRLTLITCNDQNNPNDATDCAREAITDKVAAVVGGLSIFDLDIIPYLKQAGIPWIGEATPDDYTSSNMFLLGDEGVPAYVAIGETLVQQGCKKIAIVLSAESVPAYATEITAGVTAAGHGATVVGTYTPPATNPDWASIVAALRSAGADCIGAGTGPTESGPLITAVDAGSPLKMVFLTGGTPSSLLTQLGAAADGIMGVSGYLPETSTQGAVPYLVKKSKALAPTVPFDGFTEHGYASVMVFAQAAKGLKTITSATIMKALPKIHGYNTGLGPIVSFQKPPVAAYPRLFNPYYYVYIDKKSNFYLKQKTRINASAGLRLLNPATTGGA
jgi:ABC-type branched-subunit amino acid transport system substrate-binding protein